LVTDDPVKTSRIIQTINYGPFTETEVLVVDLKHQPGASPCLRDPGRQHINIDYSYCGRRRP